MTKYQTALDLMNAVIAVKDDRDLACASWDKLYSYIHKHFKAPRSASLPAFYTINSDTSVEVAQEIQDCYAMLREHNETEVLARLTKIPPEYSDTIFPVAIARYLMVYQRVAIIIPMLKTFNEFRIRYGSVILGIVNLPPKKA